MPTFALKCTTCGRRRDPRVAYCQDCGDSDAVEDRASPIAEGSRYSDIDRDMVRTRGPAYPGNLQERRIALQQEMALIDGRNPPDVAEIRAQLEHEDDLTRAEVDVRVQNALLTGPGSSGRWEANKYGLSGHVIRGYRHWRNKR